MYEPLIKKQIKVLRIYKDHGEFFHLGRIALWHAYQQFDPQKGKFATYAMTMIRGMFMTKLRQDNRYNKYHCSASDELLSVIEYESTDIPLEKELLKTYLHHLTDREATWVYEAIILQKTAAEIAEQYHVSINTVRTWRKSALKKLRKQIKKE